jgi:hypothetical protein
MAIQLLSDFDADGYIAEPFGVKGLAELTLRSLLNDGATVAYFAYTSASAATLRKAGEKIREATGNTFTFEKLGKSYREVSYPVTRTLKNGEAKTMTITRSFLNVEAIGVTFVQNATDAAIAADDAS